MLKKPCLNVQNLQHKFLDWKWPFGTFPKIHRFWRCHPSLTVTTQGGKTKTNVCIMCMYCILSGPHTDLHNGSGNFWRLCSHYKKSAIWFSENEGGGSKAVWNFSKNSSVLVWPPFPYSITGNQPQDTQSRLNILPPCLSFWDQSKWLRQRTQILNNDGTLRGGINGHRSLFPIISDSCNWAGWSI